jgi:hypothetical protein
MRVNVSDQIIASALALAAIGLYLLSGLGRSASETGVAQSAAQILAELLAGSTPAAPSVPAFFLVPFVAAADPPLAQAVAAVTAGGLSAMATYLLIRRLSAPRRIALTVTCFSIAGTALWFGSVDARDAYVEQSVALLLSTLALLAAVDGRPAWMAGLLLAGAALSRPPLALAAPGLALLSSMYRQRPLLLSALFLSIGFAPVFMLPGTAPEGWLKTLETLSPDHLLRHLFAAAMQGPEYVDSAFLFVRPLWIGTSLLLTSPALVYAVAALRHVRGYAEVRALTLAATPVLLLNVLQGDIGAPQFGYRLALDAQCFLLPLVALGGAWAGAAWGKMRWTFVASVLWSIAAQAYGLVAILHLGLVR